MDEQTLAKLQRLKNYRTRYEIAATHPDGRKVLVGYSERKGRAGLLSMARHNAEKFAEFFQTDALQFGKRASDPAQAGEWSVNFSGRTQRDAILSGELPFFPRIMRERETAAATNPTPPAPSPAAASVPPVISRAIPDIVKRRGIGAIRDWLKTDRPELGIYGASFHGLKEKGGRPNVLGFWRTAKFPHTFRPLATLSPGAAMPAGC